MKRVLSIAIVLALVLSALAPVFAVDTEKDLFSESGKILESIGVLQGSTTGDLMLDQNLKRQDMVVLISRLYKEENKAKNFQGKNIFKDLTNKQKFYIPYITWAVDKGLIAGMDDKTFGFNKTVTVQQFQTVLLRTLGYDEEVKVWNHVPELAEKLGLMEGLTSNPKSNLSRGQMSAMTINTLRQTKKGSSLTLAQVLNLNIPDQLAVDAEVKVENTSLIFEGTAKGAKSLKLHLRPASSGITTGEQMIDVNVDEDGKFSLRVDNLQVGTYHYRFTSGSQNTSFQSVTIAALPFDLAEVKADNLKEIALIFTQPVDKSNASFASNYITTAGTIKDVRFEDNDTKVILTLNGVMTQQGKYKVSAFKIKSTSGVEKEIKDKEFQAFDNQIPKVLEVKQLGTKGMKVILSEPVKSATSSNFKVDGKKFSGTVKLENNVATLIYFSSYSGLGEGKHTLTVSGLEDYVGHRSVDQDISFDVVKDTTPPTIKNASATLEEVIIEFDEDIDPSSANKNNFYWKSGSIKKYANNVRFVDNKAIVDFSNNRLSTSENVIYVENVSDYSDNKIKSTEVKVTPVIDKTSPEVLSYKVADDGKSITVYYSKNVDGKTRSNYSIKNKDGRTVSIKDIQGSGREFVMSLYSPLPVGSNTLTIEGVPDTTPLKNPVAPFSAVIDMNDVEKPKMISHTGYGNYILIHFSKQMDMTTVGNPENYIMNFDGRQQYLPTDTQFTPGNDGKSVTITLPEQINNKKVVIGTTGNLTELDIRGLKDINGNDTDPLLMKIKFDGTSSGKAKAIDYYGDNSGRQGVLLESNLIKVKFNQPIISASTSDFTITGRTIYDVVVDGSPEITIHLNDSDDTSIPSGALRINSNNKMETSINTGVESTILSLVDKVPPRVKSNIGNLNVYGNQIELPFTEALEDEGAGLYKRDLEIIRLSDGHVLTKDDYRTSLKSSDKSIIVITIENRPVTSGYSVRVVGENSSDLTYIRDKAGNLALESGDYYNTGRDIYR